MSILPAMPQAASADGVELLELRVLDGPNRFFTRPAVKLEFGADEPGVAAAAATVAGQAVRHLYAGLELSPPRLTMRTRTTAGARRSPSRGTVAPSPRRWAPPPRAVALGLTTERRELRALRAIAPGPRPHLPTPHVPVVAITGTNGKSTTTRLIAHIARRPAERVGHDQLGRHLRPRRAGGGGGLDRLRWRRPRPGRAGLDLAVLETARGGILLRGIGYAANDVAVVTNVSADHLGLQGIDTLDELAEVKATIVRITRAWRLGGAQRGRPAGLGHARETRASWYAFSLEPDSPGVREALDARWTGRGRARRRG